MKKMLSTICILNALVLLGLVGFLAGTGRIDKPKLLAISDMLRQKGSPEGLREKLYDVMAPPPPATQTQPAAAAAPVLGKPGLEGPATAQERIDYLQKVLEEEGLRLANQRQDLQHRQDLLANQQKLLEEARAALAADKKNFEQKVAAASNTKDTAGFQKTMAVFDELKPKQVKDLLTPMTAEEITKFLTAMEAERAAKIIAEFKSPDEKTLINSVVDRLRGAAKADGTGAASASPAEPLPVLANPRPAGTPNAP